MTATPLTIAVTSANSLIGQMLLLRLKATPHHTIALVRTPIDLPADTLITNWTTSPQAMAALQRADVIVHLSGELVAKNLDEYRAANVQTTALVAEALRSGRARRVLFISFPNADPQSSNLFLKVKGEAEQLLLNSGKQAVIFRTATVINTPESPGPFEENLKAPNGGAARTVGDGQQRVHPIYRADVVAALLAALECGTPGVYDLGGPDEMTLDDLVRLVNRNPNVKITHTPGWLARILSRFIPDLPPTLVDLLLRDNRSDSSRAVAEFGLQLTSLHSLWPTSS